MKNIYYPSCNESARILKLEINPLNFSIKDGCDYHFYPKDKNIYFKTFERFYLKELEIINCSKCDLNLNNSGYYKCEVCKSFYCSKCGLDDIQSNNHKNVIFEKNTNKCTKHNRDYYAYCHNCQKNICLYCLKENKKHESHVMENLFDIIPSSETVNNLKKRIKEKELITESLIEKIDKWKREIIKNTEELTQNLKDEISFLKKIIYNFNYFFINYSYFKLFDKINKYVKNINNEYLDKFYNTTDLENQAILLIKAFKYLGNSNSNDSNKEKKIIKRSFKHHSNFNNGIIQRLENEYFIYNNMNSLSLYYYDDKSDKISQLSESKSEIKESIYSISVSDIEYKILVCLLNQKIVKIYDYNLKNKILKLNPKEINETPNQSSHFNKCIQIEENYFVTGDDIYIKIWAGTSDSLNLILIKNYKINLNTFDLLYTEEYFISSQPKKKTLILFENNNLSYLKTITNIECQEKTNCLFRLNEKYIIIACEKGLGLFCIKTKELIQFLEFNYSKCNRITCDDEENIYILNREENYNSSYYSQYYYFKIINFKFIENEIIFVNESENINTSEYNLEITSLYDDIILLWKNGLYSSKEE